ncbi:MAG: hypothetical protein Q8O44_02880, partial [Syntrophales bacterium]|nr:hypothetical protein [Syntrophales bacterium]
MNAYTIFVPYDKKEEAHKHLSEGEIISEVLQDEETREQFKAKIQVSKSPQEGWGRLHIQMRSGSLDEEWFVKI